MYIFRSLAEAVQTIVTCSCLYTANYLGVSEPRRVVGSVSISSWPHFILEKHNDAYNSAIIYILVYNLTHLVDPIGGIVVWAAHIWWCFYRPLLVSAAPRNQELNYQAYNL